MLKQEPSLFSLTMIEAINAISALVLEKSN